MDPTVFGEIRTDPDGLKNGLNLILLIFFLTSIYGFGTENMSWEFSVSKIRFITNLIAVLTDPIIIITEWITFSCGVFFITKIFKGHASLKGTLACLAYSKAPQILGFLRVLPIVGLPLGVLTISWSITCDVIAIKESSDLNTVRAILIYISLIVLAILIISTLAKFFRY